MAEKKGGGVKGKAAPAPKESALLTQAKKDFKPFLDANKTSKLIEITFEDEGTTALAIQDPWGDNSITILVANTALLRDVFNNIELPERLSAILHRDQKALEVIWTAYTLPDDHREISGRAFEFTFDGKTHKCSFTKASDRLLELAALSYPNGVSESHFRNIQSFNGFKHQDKEEQELQTYGEPICFWIDGVEVVNDKTLDMIRHLNFHIKYYDPLSPTVLIHPKPDLSKIKPRARYIAGSFPAKIASYRLNPTLLSFYAAAFGYDDPAWQFQYFYRVLEYASGYYLESKSRAAVKRALLAPDAASDPGRVATRVIDAMLGYRADDAARFSATINELVDPDLIWKEIQSNAAAFTKDTEFDGGFVVKALVVQAGPDDEFGSRGLATLAGAFKEIRNHLSHGKDKHTGNVILPTQKNLNLLRPWVHLIAISAGEVALYEAAP